MITRVGRVEFVAGEQGYQAKVDGDNQPIKEQQIFVESVPNSPCVQFDKLSRREQDTVVSSIAKRRVSCVSDESNRIRQIIIRALPRS